MHFFVGGGGGSKIHFFISTPQFQIEYVYTTQQNQRLQFAYLGFIYKDMYRALS